MCPLMHQIISCNATFFLPSQTQNFFSKLSSYQLVRTSLITEKKPNTIRYPPHSLLCSLLYICVHHSNFCPHMTIHVLYYTYAHKYIIILFYPFILRGRIDKQRCEHISNPKNVCGVATRQKKKLLFVCIFFFACVSIYIYVSRTHTQSTKVHIFINQVKPFFAPFITNNPTYFCTHTFMYSWFGFF